MDHITATFPEGFTSTTPLAQEGDKYLWVIDGYKIWAKTYAEAIDLASIISGL